MRPRVAPTRKSATWRLRGYNSRKQATASLRLQTTYMVTPMLGAGMKVSGRVRRTCCEPPTAQQAGLPHEVAGCYESIAVRAVAIAKWLHFATKLRQNIMRLDQAGELRGYIFTCGAWSASLAGWLAVAATLTAVADTQSITERVDLYVVASRMSEASSSSGQPVASW